MKKLEDILYIIIPHFEKYPLITQKHGDFLLFKQVAMIMKKKEHLTKSGIQAIINIKASFNWKLSPKLPEAFPKYVPVPRLIVQNPEIPHPEWVAGFASAEACFLVGILKNSSKLGIQVRLKFSITQHSKDVKLIQNLQGYLNCGNTYTSNQRPVSSLECGKFSDNYEKIIPLFQKYPIRGTKQQDFKDWS